MSIITARNKMLQMLQGVDGIPAIKTEGQNFKPATTKDYPFVRFMVQPRESTVQDISSGKQTASGLTWIQLYFSRSLNSSDSAFELADKVVRAYPLGSYLLEDDQLVIQTCWSEKIDEDASTIMIPVYVRWSVFAQ